MLPGCWLGGYKTQYLCSETQGTSAYIAQLKGVYLVSILKTTHRRNQSTPTISDARPHDYLIPRALTPINPTAACACPIHGPCAQYSSFQAADRQRDRGFGAPGRSRPDRQPVWSRAPNGAITPGRGQPRCVPCRPLTPQRQWW